MAKIIASTSKWWSEKIRPPFSDFRTKSTWRAKRLTLQVTPKRELVITMRRFTTAKSRRAKTHKQLVLPLRFWPGRAKELAISYKKHRLSGTILLQRTASAVVVLIGAIGIFYFGGQVLRADPAPPPASIALPTPVEAKPVKQESNSLAPSQPHQLVIPAIGVNAGIMTVGRQADGTMQTPSLYDHQAGWYELGPTPGEIGPAIIVGHVDNYQGPSVFWRLGQLKASDEIQVARKDGKTAKFRVTSVEQFDQNAFPTERVYGNTDKAELRLITCGGTFDNSTGRYTHNTVVFASLID